MRAAPLLLIAALAAGSTPSRGEPTTLVLPFEVGHGDVILVRADVDDRPALLILDTGSGRTILRHDRIRLTTDPLPASRFSGSGPGLAANGRWGVANVRLAGRTWLHRSVVGMRLEEVSRAYGREIDGILGQDLLREFRTVTVDFEAREVRLSP